MEPRCECGEEQEPPPAHYFEFDFETGKKMGNNQVWL